MRRGSTARRGPAEASIFAVDLLAIAVRSGLTIDAALCAVADVLPDAFDGALRRVATRGAAPLAATLRDLATTLASPDDLVLVVLADATETGVAVASVLDGLSTELRRRRHANVESAARRLPVVLLVPMIACLLPATLLVTLVPALLAGIERLAA